MKLIVISGTRADYGIYRPLLFELHRDPVIHLQLVVTGMHLLKEYGQTIDDVEQDPFEVIAQPSILVKGDSTYAMSQSVGIATLYFSDILHFHQPDAILLLGDRGEMLAAAIAAHYQNIAIVHLHGGEKSGSADDAVRHAISKLAHLHFVSTFQAKKALQHLGEEEWRIFPVGSLRKHDIEQIKLLDDMKKAQLMKKYRLSSKQKNVLVMMHPDTKEQKPYSQQIEVVLKALERYSEINLIFIGPNSDAGGDIFREYMQSYCKQSKWCSYHASIPSDEYLFLLSQVDLLIGNSSSGIIEAPFFHLPFINVGNRQQDRTHGDNVYHVPYRANKIKAKIQEVLQSPTKIIKHNPYDIVKAPAHEIVKQLKISL
ncbi:UDP-N-acetylglucosamine 2-epimerase [Kroppenstedtia eburnea]|uniref:GDP/UDP-N,N'-diacetylbacillosamine 2-epimerase (Hydrolysing) n=1 Tax=Kroppenstedtia eburnea TaxID=714067 RepID=A0A1N7Q8Q9_9BACL|nr:UDP-N-acetylglucosamine 2-epimerase [Kroppenstedtia eburnea]EGK12911.1 UDP-N-acetylglucosamine 2-epimerase [Desmospora sp. 8437]QKI82591.1 UDP-N-acetylglucosamine 2-epimerase (hydrolyzing) [Kroppenstedtia eburnea]SIT19240.1 GDP/UDP-N,N'-diacetylbacillosamine 2-epimerase (hydrolysing) [Kroppenstedtia eburnea]